MSLNEDQEEFDSLVQNNRLLRRTYRQMNEELQALNDLLQEKMQKKTPSGFSRLRPALPTFWLAQNEAQLHTPEEIHSLQRSNSQLHQLNATLAQLQLAMFKKLVDITRPAKRPEKQTQTRSELQTMKHQTELQSLKEQLQKELEQLRFEADVAKKEERLSLSRCSCLKICIRMTELHNNNRRRLLEEVKENQVLRLQVQLLEEKLQHRRSVCCSSLSWPRFRSHQSKNALWRRKKDKSHWARGHMF